MASTQPDGEAKLTADFDVQIFGIKHSELPVEECEQALEEFLSEETDALYLEPSPESESIWSFLLSRTLLRNPSFVLFQVLRKASLSVLKRQNRTRSEWRAAREVAEERGIDCKKVGRSQKDLVDEQGAIWSFPSWIGAILGLAVLLTGIAWAVQGTANTLPDLDLVSLPFALLMVALILAITFIITMLILHWFSVGAFLVSTRVYRDLGMAQRAIAHARRNNHRSICFVTGASHIDGLSDISEVITGIKPRTWDVREDYEERS